MRLAIFDIDGTLTNTNGVDDECFVRAFTEVHALADVSTDWDAYPHTTDSGITHHIFLERFGRPPEPAELSGLQRHFVGLMREQYAANSTRFVEIRGAAAALGRLRRGTQWAVSLATGCWRASALLKLEAAGLEAGGLPAGYAEDGLSREEIVSAAISRAQELYGVSSFERMVCVGDGLWDVRAAANLQLPFLGIGDAEAETRLRRAGASHVIRNYDDFDGLLRALHEAEVPAPPRAS